VSFYPMFLRRACTSGGCRSKFAKAVNHRVFVFPACHCATPLFSSHLVCLSPSPSLLRELLVC